MGERPWWGWDDRPHALSHGTLRGGHTKLGTASCFFTLPDAVTGRSFLLSPPSAFCFPVSSRDWPGTGHMGGARRVSERGSRNLKHSCPLNGTPAWDVRCVKTKPGPGHTTLPGFVKPKQ